MNIQAQRGTRDILPNESYKWEYVYNKAREVCRKFGFSEIITPVFEATELFTRGIGDETDIVQKEMYTFLDKGGRNITLKPEGTAGVVRAYLEHNLYAESGPVKLFYLSSCYRYEKPQAGRLREFHQFGVEMFGSGLPIADAEIIALAISFLSEMGLKNLKVGINSIGCPDCKPKFNKALKEYFENKDICELCQTRLTNNPMRVLDCKVPSCKEIAKNAPKTIDYLCDECKTHQQTLENILNEININYEINPSIVRGLDYYTRTVFEISFDNLGAQDVVCGGGRYDNLVENMGGKPTPSVGFGLGIERLLMCDIDIPEPDSPDIFIGYIGEAAQIKAFNLANKYRNHGKSAILELLERSPKAQMKYANKINAKFSCIIGEDEIKRGEYSLKNMENGEETKEKL